MTGTVIRAELLETEHETGWLVWLDFDGYRPQPYYFSEHEDWSAERKERSELPHNGNMTLFNWNHYQEDTTRQRGIIRDFIDRYMEHKTAGYGLYIFSQVKGSGKTHLATCTANAVIERYNAVVKYVNIVDYIEKVRARKDIEPYRECGLLVLDDIGAQSEKHDWINETVFRLVNYRLDNRKLTIYTSNMPFKQSSTDDRTFSRIYGSTIPVKMPEFSVREMLADKRREDFLRGIRRGIR